MSKWIPFTAHIRIDPPRLSKRVENTRALQRLAVKLYNGLIANANLNIATPGGGQADFDSGSTLVNGMSNMAGGVGIKPQFGEAPAQLQITGFVTRDENNDQVHPSHKIISGGTWYTGYTADPAEQNPTATTSSGVKYLKGLLEAAMTSEIGATIDWGVFRIDYAGVTFGDRGYTFPL